MELAGVTLLHCIPLPHPSPHVTLHSRLPQTCHRLISPSAHSSSFLGCFLLGLPLLLIWPASTLALGTPAGHVSSICMLSTVPQSKPMDDLFERPTHAGYVGRPRYLPIIQGRYPLRVSLSSKVFANPQASHAAHHSAPSPFNPHRRFVHSFACCGVLFMSCHATSIMKPPIFLQFGTLSFTLSRGPAFVQYS